MSLLEVEQLRVVYRTRTNRRDRPREVRAVDGVDLSVEAGRTVGLVGASGAGKTTVGKAIVHLVRAESGRVTVGDFDVTGFTGEAPLRFRKDVQMVFQTTMAALNPALTVGDALQEPLRLHVGTHDLALRTEGLLDAVGLPASYTTRRPHELSVGERQRVAIARALAPEPRLIVLDEPVSGLDAITRSRMVRVVQDLQRERSVAYLLITHDIALAHRVCERIAVMYRGRVVEEGTSAQVCERPQHPFTKLLIASVPHPDPAMRRAARQERRRLAEWL